MPYVDIRPSKCFYCEKQCRVKMVFPRTGLYVEVCLDHLKEFVNNLYEDDE